MLLFVITMFIDGGLIARYLVVRDLGMLNTIWAVVLPGAVGVWNLIIARSFFEHTVPNELREAAQMDGANDFTFFFKMVLPLSKPLIMLMIMIHVVAHWNSFFDALIFLNDDTKYPLQLVLRNILIQSDVSSAGTTGGDIESYAAAQRIAELTKYAMIVVSRACPHDCPALHAEALHQGRHDRRREIATASHRTTRPRHPPRTGQTTPQNRNDHGNQPQIRRPWRPPDRNTVVSPDAPAASPAPRDQKTPPPTTGSRQQASRSSDKQLTLTFSRNEGRRWPRTTTP